MNHSTLIVPGYRGSGPEHWQSWLETELSSARRVDGIDWAAPRLDVWSAAVLRAIDDAGLPVWLVAHSFGCLASVLAASVRPDQVAGVLLVAPADPERFSANGFRADSEGASVADKLSAIRLGCPSLLVASTNDPWANFSTVAYWAQRWGCRLLDLGRAGHINVDSGFGPWPQGLALLQSMQQAPAAHLLGTMDPS